MIGPRWTSGRGKATRRGTISGWNAGVSAGNKATRRKKARKVGAAVRAMREARDRRRGVGGFLRRLTGRA